MERGASGYVGVVRWGDDVRREESERVMRVARVTARADEVFGESERAGRWLRKSQSRF